MNARPIQPLSQSDIFRGMDGARSPRLEMIARAERAKAVQAAREAFFRRAPSPLNS